jgi:hypothetical protein
MFFVGATGQLLTLILTVCLPFIFILSGHQNIKITNSSLQPEVNQIQHKISYREINVVSYSEAISVEDHHCNFIIEDCRSNKIPLREFNVKRESLYIDSSGNKAPPVFNCFC